MNNDYSSIDEPQLIPVTGMHNTTADEVLARASDPATGHIPGSNPNKAVTVRGGVFNQYIDGLGFRPENVKTTKVKFEQAESVTIPAGFYLLSGGTGGGKSITAAALLITAKAQGVSGKYLYCYEARTPASDGTVPNPFFSGGITAATDKDRAMTSFIEFLPRALIGVDSSLGTAIIMIDSVALPMRAYRSADRQNMSTMKEGLQPMDIAFVIALEEYAVKNNFAIFGVINDDLVPFAAKLEGMSEGILIVHSPGVFSLRSRFDRKVHECSVSKDALDAGGAFLHYPAYDKSRATIWGTEGLS